MKKGNYLNWLLSPWAIISGIVVGIFIGCINKKLAIILIPFGKTYLSLLQMCIVPILISAVVSGMGRLVSEGDANRYLKKLVLIFILGLLIASALGVVIGIIAKPGTSLDKKSRIVLGKLLAKKEMESSGNEVQKSPQLMDFLFNMVPKNVFAAVAKDQNLAILFFSIILGIALGFVRSQSSNLALSVVEGLYDSFQKMIAWIMYGLPIGLCCLFAAQVVEMGLEIIGALIKLVLFVYFGAVLLMIFYQYLISRRVKVSFFRSLLSLRETLVVAFGTSSSFAAIPSALRCLTDQLKLDKQTTNLVVPLGMSINPQGNAFHFALSTIFIAQIYNTSLGAQGFFIILIGAVLAGMAATGAPGVGSLAMISLILEPLGLPVESTIILLLAVDPILDPVLTVVNVHSNCAATALVAEPQDINKDTNN